MPGDYRGRSNRRIQRTAYDFAGVTRGTIRAYGPGRLYRLAPKVRVPTTHVWSDGDTALVRRGADLTARYVNAPYELVIMKDVTHWVPDHEPAALADVILARARSVRIQGSASVA
jgi:pimeloyl-ACP methyl ester carboxylesterase